MLWVIFYCGLISFVVSARPINNTSLTDATASNNSDTRLVTEKSNGTSNADHARKDCVFQIEENDITNIVERTDDLVNIVDFHFFKGTGQNEKLFEDVQIALVTIFGREILLILDEKRYSIAGLTLNAGRENVNVHFKNVSLTNCTKQHVAESMLEQIVLRNKNPRNYEICYAERRVKQTDRKCCRITDTDLTNFKYECSKKDSFLQRSAFSLILTILMIGTLPFLFWAILSSLLGYSAGKICYAQYYKLEESTMSPIRFFVKIVWKEQGLISVTLIRKCVIILALCVNIRLCIIYATSDTYLWGFFVPTVPFSLGILFLLYFDRFRLYEISIVIDEQLFEFWVTEITSLVHLLKFTSVPGRRLTRLDIFFSFVLSPLYLSFFFSLFFLELTIILGYAKNNKKYYCRDFFLIVDTIVSMALYIFQFHISYILTFAIQSLLLGLFLNFTYFLPYLTAISVFTFYGHGIWNSLTEKYLLLKLLIYEECQEKKAKTNEINGTPQKDQKLVSVVPKKIYDTIREKLLPYEETVSWAVIKLLLLLVFSYGILELVRMLHTYNTTAGIKVVVTASVGILPRIFNTITWNAGGEEGKEAWKKNIKLNLKRMIKAIPDDEIVLSTPSMVKYRDWIRIVEHQERPILMRDLQNEIRYVDNRFIHIENFKAGLKFFKKYLE